MTTPHLLCASVGLLFGLSGIAKAIDTARFVNHLKRFELFPEWTLPIGALGLIGLEFALATLLLTFSAPHHIIQVALALLLGVSLISLWGQNRKGIHDCGCYGRVARPQISTTIAVNLLAAMALLFALGSVKWAPFSQTDLLIGIQSGALGIFIAGRSAKEPWIDFSPLKAGKNWPPMHQNALPLPNEPTLFFFLSPTCENCRKWVPKLHQYSQPDASPKAQWILSERDELESFKLGAKVAPFIVPPNVIDDLVGSFPVVVLIQDGVIQKRWNKFSTDRLNYSLIIILGTTKAKGIVPIRGTIKVTPMRFEMRTLT